MNVIIVALGGGLGAVCRYGLSLLPFSSTWPLATFLTNVLGAFVMGLIVGLSEERKLLSPNATLFWKVGFCGGFTTFSSFSLETVRLVDQQNYGLALVYSVSSILACLIALMFGRYLAMNNPKPQEWKAEELSQGRIMDYKAFNFVDGEGVRCSLYVAGCPFHCEGCYNVATWNFRAGVPYTSELEEQIMADLSQPYVQGLTLLGGEPFLNTGILIPLVKRVREELPDKDIWSWTGYTWEELMLETPDKLELLSLVDILVDGRFDRTKRDLTLQFRGSSNQRIIDVSKSLASKQVVLWDKLVR